jgi:hypothetical protein
MVIFQVDVVYNWPNKLPQKSMDEKPSPLCHIRRGTARVSSCYAYSRMCACLCLRAGWSAKDRVSTNKIQESCSGLLYIVMSICGSVGNEPTIGTRMTLCKKIEAWTGLPIELTMTNY